MKWALIVAAAFIAGYWLAPKDLLDGEVEQTGFLQTDTKHILSATVESLRRESKLLVLSHKGTVEVEVAREWLWLFHGEQRLHVTGVVPYYVDLEDLTYEYEDGTVTVKLPPVVLGVVAFAPERATTINGGVLTFDQDNVDEMLRANYLQARRAMTAQAQGFRWLAEQRAQDVVAGQLERAVPGVVVRFR